MRKILYTLAIIIVIASVSASLAFQPDKNLKPSEYEIGVTYKEALEDDKPVFAMFYVDWCTYCQRFMPKLKLINMIYKNDFNIVKINCDEPENKKLAADYGIEGFPTIYIIDNKYDNRVHISSSNYGDLGRMRKELDRYKRIRGLLDKAGK